MQYQMARIHMMTAVCTIPDVVLSVVCYLCRESGRPHTNSHNLLCGGISFGDVLGVSRGGQQISREKKAPEAYKMGQLSRRPTRPSPPPPPPLPQKTKSEIMLNHSPNLQTEKAPG